MADRGPSIPTGSAPRLFEPFYRADSTGQSATEGVGLGLALVKAIIDAHRGRVGATNRPDRGARFWFEVPAVTVATRSSAGSGACKEETR